MMRRNARDDVPRQLHDAGRLREYGDARHLQAAIEVLGDAEEFVRKDLVKNTFAVPPAAVRTRDDSFGYHSHEGPVGIFGDERLAAASALPDGGGAELVKHCRIERGKGRAASEQLRPDVAIHRLGLAMGQTQLPELVGDLARLDDETIGTVLRHARRKRARLLFGNEGK